MKCYQCNCRLAEDRDTCPKCGADVRLYRKVIYASNQYYNLALQRARARDLTGAAENLRISIQLNKRNTNARNLLGLVYYEMGEAALALKEWIISKNFRHRQNIADTYIQEMRGHRQALDSADHSIRKFNQALEYARSGARDMAVIQLKKVISVNPRMLKAYQLLALLYMNDQNYDLAKAVIQRSLEIDCGNPVSLSYKKELEQYRTQEEPPVIGVAGELEREEVIVPVRVRDYGSYLMSAAYILIGFVLALGILYYVIIPGREAQYAAVNTANQSEYESRAAALNADMEELQTRIEELQAENEQAEGDYKEANSQTQALMQSYLSLLSVSELYITGDYEGIADSFQLLDADATDDPVYQKIYAELKSDYEDNLANRLYQMATVAREQNQDRETAIRLCQTVLEMQPDYDSALFYQALCYQELGDSNQAITLYVDYALNESDGIWMTEVRNHLFELAPQILTAIDAGTYQPDAETPEAQNEDAGQEGADDQAEDTPTESSATEDNPAPAENSPEDALPEQNLNPEAAP